MEKPSCLLVMSWKLRSFIHLVYLSCGICPPHDLKQMTTCKEMALVYRTRHECFYAKLIFLFSMYILIIYITQRKKFTGGALNMISHMYSQLIISQTVWRHFTVFFNLLNDSHSLIFTWVSYKSYTHTYIRLLKGGKKHDW